MNEDEKRIADLLYKKCEIEENENTHPINNHDVSMNCDKSIGWVESEEVIVELSKPDTLGSFDLLHPIVHQILNNRYGDEIPYNELVVAPSDIFKSKLLEEISRLDGINN